MKPTSCAVLATMLSFALSPASAESRLGSRLLPPVAPACISSAFGPRVLPNVPQAGTYHYGVDLPAPDGTPVVAAAPGTVLRIQHKDPGGLEMLVQHNGFVGVYSHFGMVLSGFTAGSTVKAGEILGVVGRTGISSGPHMYFEMLRDGKPVDPAPYLGIARCDGRPMAQEAVAVPSAKSNDGVTVGGRRYYQVLLPSQQYYQWHQN